MSDPLRQRRDALRAELAAVERELGESASRGVAEELQAALVGASEFVVLIDEDLRVVYNNRLQPGVADIVGRPVLDFIDAPYHAHVREIIAQARKLGHPCPGRIDARGPRGTTGAYHLWAVPLSTPIAGATMTLIGFEATHLQRVEQALQDERSVVHSLIMGVPDTILIVDRELRITFVNRTRGGGRREDVMGTDALAFIPESARERVRSAIESAFERGDATSYESRVDLAPGSFWYFTRVVPLKRDDTVVRVCLVATDITEQRQREMQLQRERQALQQSEARFRSLVEHAPEALVIFDADEGRFAEVSDSACELFGLEREELTRRGPIELSPPIQPDGRPTGEVVGEYVERAMREGSAQFEWLLLNGEGREMICEVHLVVLPHEQRRLICGSVFDITDKKRAEEEHASLQEQLFQAQKMQALGQLTGGVAHDFNNLLTVIMSHAELLKRNAGNEDRVVEHAHQMQAAATRAAALTQQLLAFARRQPLVPQRIDLTKLVAHMQRLLTRTLGETIEVRTELGESLWDCSADRALLENAMLNLALNARDAMPEGGALTIAIENRHQQSVHPHGEVPPGRYVAIHVADDGTGMSAETAAQAFEPFFTTKPVGRGSGMGLSMVYGFAKQSGGHVELESTPGRGTHVTLYLPAADLTSPPTVDSTPDPARGGEGELILVVEDEPAVREATVTSLKCLGYRAVDAADAASALRVLAETEGIALVLTDVVLAGGVSGLQLAERIGRVRPKLPVTFMSGYAKDVEEREGGLPRGAHLLTKPFTQGELASAVRAAIERAREA